MARLRRVDCSGPGITRRRRGRGFEYLDEGGDRIADADVVERIADLAIPPAWRDVWISPHAMGHLQATGIDDAGRKQYLYHRKWRERRDQQKFDSMIDFARALPLMRRRVARDLDRDGMGRERVLACAVRLLDRGFFRVGGESYAADNDSYGLATIEKGHVKLGDDRLEFDYPSKSGKRREQSVVDHDVHDIVAALEAQATGHRAPRLQGRPPLGRREVRGHQRLRQGGDRRRLHGEGLPDLERHGHGGGRPRRLGALATGSKTGRKRAEARAVKEVAGYLGNTPTVARTSYIDPRVFDRFRSGRTIGGVLAQVGDSGDIGSLHGPVEDAVLDLLVGGESPAIERAAA